MNVRSLKPIVRSMLTAGVMVGLFRGDSDTALCGVHGSSHPPVHSALEAGIRLPLAAAGLLRCSWLHC